MVILCGSLVSLMKSQTLDYSSPLYGRRTAQIKLKQIEYMPEISRFYGIIIYMYIDDHNPPHFHVWYEGYEATITIEDGIVTGTLPRRALKMVYEWLDLHFDELMENWRLLTNFEAAKKINPLK